ncbi:hypothetical protein N7495_009597 [Penicillium taxi]|uniref:uncharacterized protein n=1 Tax=Penicillium taxi TaxID=168475 RepID=UPI00254502E5|nr:uncharacterized protein N7495_009597 [Penicillium taxi]KAJ5885087.1 hypothetical protein N7495_009597 [Penicillium taxi]
MSSDAGSAVDNSLDDIFGSSPPETEHEQREPTNSNELSDLPSLRRQHVTAGYRDGVTASKSQNVQAGFDAGFPIGAQLGMRAGTILGILEGITRGLEDKSASVVKNPARASESNPASPARENRLRTREQVLAIYNEVLKAFDVQSVFSGLTAEPSTGSGKLRKEKPEAQLSRKGDAVITTWEGTVSVPKWEENMDALEMKEGENTGGVQTERI